MKATTDNGKYFKETARKLLSEISARFQTGTHPGGCSEEVVGYIVQDGSWLMGLAQDCPRRVVGGLTTCVKVSQRNLIHNYHNLEGEVQNFLKVCFIQGFLNCIIPIEGLPFSITQSKVNQEAADWLAGRSTKREESTKDSKGYQKADPMQEPPSTYYAGGHPFKKYKGD